MLKRSFFLIGLAAALALALSPDLASAQRRGGGGGSRGGGSYRGGGSVYRGGGSYYRGGGYGYRGGDWDRRGWGGWGWGGIGIGIGLGYPGYGGSYGYSDYSPGYYYGDGGAIYDSTPYYSGTPVYGSNLTPSLDSYGYGAPTQEMPAQINVRVPADAKVWFDGTATEQQGTNRVFASPALTPGRDYHYTVKAQWREGDKDVTQLRRVDVRAGTDATVDFNRPAPPEQTVNDRSGD
jgi:uncharacterized protein (TIGR03000 family)